jgi:UDP-glucose 6-dehydrogenase
LFWIEQGTGIVTHNCFSKDINAFIYYAESLGYDIDLLKKVWEINLRTRKNIDWKDIEGAVTDPKKRQHE